MEYDKEHGFALGAYRLGPDHEPIKCTIEEWGEWFQDAERHVAQTFVGGLWVSTVFLGIDHGWSKGRPVLFETMTFGPANDEFACARYCTWADAEQGHAAIVAQIKRNRWRRPDLWAWRVFVRDWHELVRMVKRIQRWMAAGSSTRG